MPTIDQAVDFLIRNKALELGESPWPSWEDNQDSYEIDWGRMFPSPRDVVFDNDLPYGDDWDIAPTAEEEAELNRVLGTGAPQRQPSGEGIEPQWDICAWYQPIHFFGHNWGIFIKEECVKRTSFMIARFVDPAAAAFEGSRTGWFKALYRAAVYLYFLHEQYHHKIECLGFRLHVVERKSVYMPYHKLVYAPTKGTDDQLEEALANADCYRRLATEPYATWLTRQVVKATRRYLEWQFPFDPPGYRKAVDYLTEEKFDAGENELQGQVKETSLKPAQPADEWELAPRMTQSFFPVTANIFTVIPSGTTPRLPVKYVAPVRTCSTREMIDLFRQAGYEEVDGGKGSHVKLKKAGALTMVLPGNRRELSPGVAKTALRVLGDFNLHDLARLVRDGFSPHQTLR